MSTKARLFQAKSADVDGSFSAVVATLGVPDRDGDTIAPGAFSGRPVLVVPSHVATHVPIGKVRIEERGHEAVAVGKFNLGIQSGRDWLAALRFDLTVGPRPLQEWSFGFDVIEADRLAGGGRRIRKLREIEVSPVLRGAGVGTRTTCAGDVCKSASPSRSGSSCGCGCGGSCSRGGPGARRRENVIGKHAENLLATLDAGERYRYRVVSAPRRLNDLAERVCRAWGIDPPVVKMMREAGPGEPADVRYGEPITGLHAPGEVFVLDGRGLLAEMRTLGHELCHCWQRAQGVPAYEPQAERFGERFMRWAVYAPADLVPVVV